MTVAPRAEPGEADPQSEVDPRGKRQALIGWITELSTSLGNPTQAQTAYARIAQHEEDRADREKEHTLRLFALLENIAKNPTLAVKEWAILTVVDLVKTLAEARNELKSRMARKPEDLIENIGTERLSTNEISCARSMQARPQIAILIRTNPRPTKSVGIPLIWLTNRQHITHDDLEILPIILSALIVLFENISRITGTRLPTDMGITVNTGLQAIFQEDLQPEERSQNLMNLATLLNQMLAMAQGTTVPAPAPAPTRSEPLRGQEVQNQIATQLIKIREQSDPETSVIVSQSTYLNTVAERITSAEEASIVFGQLTAAERKSSFEIRFAFIFLCITSTTAEVRLWAISALTEGISTIIGLRNAFGEQRATDIRRSSFFKSRTLREETLKRQDIQDIVSMYRLSAISDLYAKGIQPKNINIPRALTMVIASYTPGTISEGLVIVSNLLKDLIEDVFLIESVANPGIQGNQFTDENRTADIASPEEASRLTTEPENPGRRKNAFYILSHLRTILDCAQGPQHESIGTLSTTLSEAMASLMIIVNKAKHS